MHRRLILAAAPLLLTGCSPQPPAYTQVNVTEQTATGYADLVLPDATTSQARDAITNYTAGITGQELYYVKVVHAEDASRYVCRARWYRDAAAYRQHGNDPATPTSWPHLAINCP